MCHACTSLRVASATRLQPWMEWIMDDWMGWTVNAIMRRPLRLGGRRVGAPVGGTVVLGTPWLRMVKTFHLTTITAMMTLRSRCACCSNCHLNGSIRRVTTSWIRLGPTFLLWARPKLSCNSLLCTLLSLMDFFFPQRNIRPEVCARAALQLKQTKKKLLIPLICPQLPLKKKSGAKMNRF